MANFSFVVDSSYDPMSLQEMMIPWAMYKESYDKQEETYLDLINKADKFKYLSERLPENSRARQIYEGYANDLSAAASDFGDKGLTMGSRSALFGLRRRYQGEIGRLAEADEMLKNVQKTRAALASQGVPMIYGKENLTIDDFLDGNMANTWGVNAEDLYKKGAEFGKAVSSRQYSSGDAGSILGGYYRKWVDTIGIDPRNIGAFMNSDTVQGAADQYLAQMGVTQNLKPGTPEYQRAKQTFLNGVYNSIVYSQSTKPIEDKGVLSADKRLAMEASGYVFDNQGRIVGYNQDKDVTSLRDAFRIQKGLEANPAVADAAKLASLTGGTGSTGSKSGKKSSKGEDEQTGYDTPVAVPHRMYSKTEIAQKTKDADKFKSSGDLVLHNGKYVISEKGLKKLKKESGGHQYSDVLTGELKDVDPIHSKFYKELVKLNGGKPIFKPSSKQQKPSTRMERWFGSDRFDDYVFADGMNVNKLNNLITKYLEDAEGGGKDAFADTEYRVTPNSVNITSLTNAIIAQPLNSYKVVEYAGKDGFKERDIKRDNLKNYTLESFAVSKFGITARMIPKEGFAAEPGVIKLPRSINVNAYDNAVAYAKAADTYAQIVHKKLVPEKNANGTIRRDKDGNIVFSKKALTAEQLQAYTNDYNRMVARIYAVASTILPTVNNEAAKVAPPDYDDELFNP